MENENEQKLEINTEEKSVRTYDTQENRDESKDKFSLKKMTIVPYLFISKKKNSKVMRK